MIGELIQIGEKVAVQIPQENREWGYNPCADGTEVEVLGFAESFYSRVQNFGHGPGVFENRSWIKVLLNGAEHLILSSNLNPVDAQGYEKRLQEFRASNKKNGWPAPKKLRELPETKFWEMDIVKHPGEGLVKIHHINYDYIGKTTVFGTPMPLYTIQSLSGGWTTSAGEESLTLIERGNVWNYYHGSPLSFSSLQEEANFYQTIGRTKEIRNPDTGNYAWTKDEILDAIRKGIAHGMAMGTGLLGMTPKPYAIFFLDEEVGRRVARATLEGFEV